MRLLFVNNLFPPHHIGGYELVCQRVAEGMEERGHQVRVLTSSHGTDPGVDCGIHRILSCAYRPPGYFPDAQGDEASHNAGLLASQIDEYRPDVAVLWNMHGLGMSPTYAAALDRASQVATRLGDYQFWPDWDPERPMDVSLQAILRDPRLRVAANCRTLGRELIRAGVRPADVVVLHSSTPFPDSVLPAEPPPPPPVRLLWAGRIAEHKGLMVAARGSIALARDHGIPARLTVVGQGDEGILAACISEVEAAAAGGGADVRMEYLGELGRLALAQSFPGYHVYLATSEGHDAFPITAVEAMAAGTPVVASRLGGLVEITAGGKLGLLFEPGDWSGMASQVARLARDPRLRRRLRTESRHHAEAHFTRQVALDRFEEFLRGCAEGRTVSQMPSAVPRMLDALPTPQRWLCQLAEKAHWSMKAGQR